MTDTTELRRRLREALTNRKRSGPDVYADSAIRLTAAELLTALDAEDAEREKARTNALSDGFTHFERD